MQCRYRWYPVDQILRPYSALCCQGCLSMQLSSFLTVSSQNLSSFLREAPLQRQQLGHIPARLCWSYTSACKICIGCNPAIVCHSLTFLRESRLRRQSENAHMFCRHLQASSIKSDCVHTPIFCAALQKAALHRV